MPEDQGPLCSGISEEILNKLACFDDLKVIARTSSFLFDSSATPIREIGRRLGVRNVLEGSARVSNNQVRISAQLIDAESEFHRWSKSYTRDLADIFVLYDELATEIGEELRVVIGDTAKPASPPTHNLAAYNLMLRARFQLDQRGRAKEASELVEQALALDPNYAEAYCVRCWLLIGQGRGRSLGDKDT